MSCPNVKNVFDGQEGSADEWEGDVDLTLKLGYDFTTKPQQVKVRQRVEVKHEDVDVSLRLGYMVDEPVLSTCDQAPKQLKGDREKRNQCDIDVTLRLGTGSDDKKILSAEWQERDMEEIEEVGVVEVKTSNVRLRPLEVDIFDRVS